MLQRSLIHTNSVVPAHINNILVGTGIFFLLAGFPITVLTGDKYHYYLFAIICMLLLVLNITPYFNLVKTLYFTPLLVSCSYHIVAGSVDKAFILSLLPYIIIPLVFFHRSFVPFKFDTLMRIIDVFSILNFLGVVAQSFGVTSDYLYAGALYSDIEVQSRFGSFAGGTLALGFIGCVSAVHAFIKIIYFNQKTIYNVAIFLCSWSALLLGLSRRFYITTLVLMVIIYLFNPQKTYSLKRKRMVLGSLIAFLGTAVYFMFVFKDNFLLLRRAFSTFDFENDPANIERVAKWIIAGSNFLENFWMGMGVGSMGMIGKDYDATTDISDVMVAESYYLKVFAEGGVFFGGIFLLLMFYLLYKAFRSIRKKELVLPSCLIILFFIDSIMGTSLEGPLGSVLFWIAAVQLIEYKAP